MHEVVRDEQRGRVAFAGETREKRHNLGASSAVEGARRLVDEQHPRLVHEGTRDRDALTLATRELRGAAIGVVAEADGIEQLIDAAAHGGPPRAPPSPAELGHHAELLARGEGGEHVLVLTNYDTDGDILGAVEAGASGYLLKDAPPHELLAGVRAAAAGQSAVAPAIAGRLLARLREPRVTLSVREIEVLRLVARGASNADVAAHLHITDATVKSHLAHVFSKLGVSSRTAAVSSARALGIVR